MVGKQRHMSHSVVIIDYGSGNLRSVAKAFERIAMSGAVHGGVPAVITVSDDPAVIEGADRIVLPGVGAFNACLTGLRARPGVVEILETVVLKRAKPFLGICVGMQLMAQSSAEFSTTDDPTLGLGWIDGTVVGLEPRQGNLCVPHMGWNAVEPVSAHPVMDGLHGQAFYFAHSYHFRCENLAHQQAICCLLYTSPSPRDRQKSRMPSSA